MKEERVKTGLHVNIKKTKIMTMEEVHCTVDILNQKLFFCGGTFVLDQINKSSPIESHYSNITIMLEK